MQRIQYIQIASRTATVDSRGMPPVWGTWKIFRSGRHTEESLEGRKKRKKLCDRWNPDRGGRILRASQRLLESNPKTYAPDFLHQTGPPASSRPDCFCAPLPATSAAWPATARLRTASARGSRPSPQSAPLPLCPTFAPVRPPVRIAAKFQCLTPVPPRIGMRAIAKRSGPGPHARSRQSSRPGEPEYPFTHATTHMYQSEIAVIQSGTASSVNCTKVFVKLQELRNQLLPRPVVLSTSSPIANSYTSYIESRFAPQNDLARTDD
jgi:hypothetical protein